MLTISWVPLGVQRIYALVTYDVVKSSLRKTAEALSDEITSMISRFDNSLSFYVYLFVGGVLFRQTLSQWFKRSTGRGRVMPINSTVRIAGETVNSSVRTGLKMQPILSGSVSAYQPDPPLIDGSN